MRTRQRLPPRSDSVGSLECVVAELQFARHVDLQRVLLQHYHRNISNNSIPCNAPFIKKCSVPRLVTRGRAHEMPPLQLLLLLQQQPPPRVGARSSCFQWSSMSIIHRSLFCASPGLPGALVHAFAGDHIAAACSAHKVPLLPCLFAVQQQWGGSKW